MPTRRRVLAMGATGAAALAGEALVPGAIVAAAEPASAGPVSRSFAAVVVRSDQNEVDVREADPDEQLPRRSGIRRRAVPCFVTLRAGDLVAVTDYLTPAGAPKEFVAMPICRWEAGEVKVDSQGRYVIDEQVAAPVDPSIESFPGDFRADMAAARREGGWMEVCFLETRLPTAHILNARPIPKPKRFLPWQ